VSSLWTRLLGSATVAAGLRGQTAVPFLPRERLDALRDRRIRRIVEYAARHVPYYRQLFKREGIDWRDVRGASELDRLPLLDKELVRAQPRLFIAETAEARSGISFLTSGSTGTPIEIHHDRRSLLLNMAFGEREREPLIRAAGTFRPKEVYLGYETSTFKKVIDFYARSLLMPVRPRRRFASLADPMEKIAAVLNEEQPDLLVGYGGWIDLFFRTVAARGLELRPPKLVLYMGEALPLGGRAFIEETFGIPVVSRYNAVESFKIGYYCEHRTGFHLHDDLCHVRIVDDRGQPVPAGEQGQVVISNLVNRGSVLLNYPIGDVASLSAERCPCGRTFRLLSELEGRVEDILELADGTFIHPRRVWEIFKGDADVLQYQLVQHEPDRFELTLVTVDDGAFTGAFERARPRLLQLLGGHAQVEAARGTELTRETGRKFRAVESRCRR
jgi:phenylacetate-CoA ligase